ncbi:uncharacterized protein isoform X1 [Danio rerio]|uniref:Uncharacterized protein isoform X1 n=1 Tax=Danio rerio TaxID=7955 RepID=A0AC58JDG3_DANRE
MCFLIPVVTNTRKTREVRCRRNPHNLRSIHVSAISQLSLSEGLWNCQSAVNKAHFITSIATYSDYNLMSLTETWLRPEDTATHATLSANFSFSHTPRQTGRGGGTGLLISKEWKFTLIPSLPTIRSFEFHAVTIIHPFYINVLVIYRPPGKLGHFLDELDVLLSSFSNIDTPLLVLGDFNIYVDKPQAADFQTLLASFDLKRAPTSATHKSDLMVLKEETLHQNEKEEKQQFEKHQVIMTDEKPTLSKKTSSRGRPRKSKSMCNYSCTRCRKSFSKKSNLDIHMRVHTKEKPYTCKQCGKRFGYIQGFENHMRIHTGERPYTCQQCGKSFYHAGNFAAHQRIHTGQRKYTCQHCGKSFSKTGNLAVHMRIHTGEKPYSCSQCGKSFKQNVTLKIHMRTHNEERIFTCTQCGKSISQKHYLDIHMRIHTGEKPYTCTECGKSFPYKGSLKHHMISHSGEKPFACAQCGKSFTTKASLMNHMDGHTGTIVFTCDRCGKTFTRKDSMKQHMKTHSGEDRLRCSECGKGFKCKRSLSTHLKLHNGEQK